MADLIQDKIKRSLDVADDLYHRLVLLVGESSSGKTCALRGIADDFDTEVININLAVSTELLELTDKQRTLQLPRIIGRVVDKARSTVVLDNLEILFDKDLEQDPLRLLQSISRNRTILASWSGTISGRTLIYSEIGHPEYRYYKMIDELIVGMDGTATIDSEKKPKEDIE